MNVEFLRRSFFALFLIAAAAGSAQEVTQAEKDRALEYLESTSRMFWRPPEVFPRRNGTSSRGRISGARRRSWNTSPHRKILSVTIC